jgi:pilus assembly protein Flp/PilA
LKLNIYLEAFDMRKFLNDVKTLSKDQDGVVSFEYVVVAFAVVSAVLVGFGTATGGTISDALIAAIAAIVAKLPA